jgi:hypothetical protein
MANEIQLAYGTTGRTLYAVVRTTVGTVWNGAAFVAFNAPDWADYDVAMTEQGASGYYTGTFPVVAAGTYNVEVRDRSGDSPAVTDPVAGGGDVNWNGTAVQSLSTVAFADGALTALSISDGGANRLADHFKRRRQANVELSAYGDALSLSSEYGFVQQAQDSNTVDNPGSLTVYQTDGTTELGQRVMDTDAAAEPIVGVS